MTTILGDVGYNNDNYSTQGRALFPLYLLCYDGEHFGMVERLFWCHLLQGMFPPFNKHDLHSELAHTNHVH